MIMRAIVTMLVTGWMLVLVGALGWAYLSRFPRTRRAAQCVIQVGVGAFAGGVIALTVAVIYGLWVR